MDLRLQIGPGQRCTIEVDVNGIPRLVDGSPGVGFAYDGGGGFVCRNVTATSFPRYRFPAGGGGLDG
jgi:hypothetical protein